MPITDFVFNHPGGLRSFKNHPTRVMGYNPSTYGRKKVLIAPQRKYWAKLEKRGVLTSFAASHVSHESLHAALCDMGLPCESYSLDALYSSRPGRYVFYGDTGMIIPHSFLTILGEENKHAV